MKRIEAINSLKKYLDEEEYTIDKHEIPFVTRHFADIVIEFLEKEIGMRPPMYKKDGPDKCLSIIDWTGTVGDTWEPEESDREREFQSKKDSCI